MRWMLALLTIVLSFSSFAQSNGQSRVKTKKTVSSSEPHWHLLIGQEYRPEANSYGDMEDRTLTNMAFGYRFSKILALAEYSRFQVGETESVMSVNRTYEDAMLWAEYLPIKWNWIEPFFGAGAGFSRTKVQTRFYSSESESIGRTKGLAGANLGIKLNIPYIWLSAEIRVIGNDGYTPSYFMGGLVRAGFVF